MDVSWIAGASAILLFSVLFLVKKNRGVTRRKWKDCFSRFDDVIRSVEMTNGAYFRSLEMMLKNLESVRARTEQVEQRLWGIIARPGIERADRYEAAALLLAQGHRPAKVASMLNLPLSQVKSSRGPQNFTGKEGAIAAQRTTEGNRSNRKNRTEIRAARRPKNSARSTLQNDVVASDAVDFLTSESKMPRRNGAIQ